MVKTRGHIGNTTRPTTASSGMKAHSRHIVSRLRAQIRGSQTSLASFYNQWEHSMHGDYQSARGDPKADKAPSGRSRGGGLFPFAAVAVSRSSRPLSSRRAARWRRRIAAKAMTQVILGVSSWVVLGRPAKCPGTLEPPISPAHGLALAHIERSSLHWIRLIESSADLVGSGRRGRAVARHLAELRTWLKAFLDACQGYGPVRGGPAPLGYR